MDIYGEQGPFEDAVAGATDHTGWVYWRARYGSPPDLYCHRCGERLTIESGDQFCWHCDNPVPWDWERDHEDALVMTTGGILAHKGD